MSEAKTLERPPSESEEDEPTVQRALKRLLQAIKPENNANLSPSFAADSKEFFGEFFV
jgi:hypothetical protein